MRTRHVSIAVLCFSIVFAAGCAQDYEAEKNYPTVLDAQKVAEAKAAELAIKKKERELELLIGQEARLREKLRLRDWTKKEVEWYEKLDTEKKIFALQDTIAALTRYEPEFIAKEKRISDLTKEYDVLWAQKRARYLATLLPTIKKEEKATKAVGFDKLSHEAKIAKLEEEIENLREDGLIAQFKAAKDAEEKVAKAAKDAKDLADEAIEKAAEAKKLADAEAKKLPEYGPAEIAQLTKLHGTAKMYFVFLNRAKIDIEIKIEHIQKRYETSRKVHNAKEKLEKEIETAKEKANNEKEVLRLEKELMAVNSDLARLDRDETSAIAAENKKLAHNTIEINRANKHAKFLVEQMKTPPK